MDKKWIIGLVVVIIIAAIVGFFALNKKPSPVVNSSLVTPSKSPTGEEHAAVNAITVEGNDFSFSPSTIVTKAGQKLTITFKNMGKFPHNLSIEGIGASKTIQSGESDTFSITPAKAGTFPFKCTVPTHADKGMVGALTVQSN